MMIHALITIHLVHAMMYYALLQFIHKRFPHRNLSSKKTS